MFSKLFSWIIPAPYIFSLQELVTECKEKVKSERRWSELQRVGKWNVKRRSLKCREE
jgi:hypothetical protein